MSAIKSKDTIVPKDTITPVSKVVELFDGDRIAPGTLQTPVNREGSYPEQATVYYPGGSSTLKELREIQQTGRPGQVGGFRRAKKSRARTLRRRHQRRPTIRRRRSQKRRTH